MNNTNNMKAQFLALVLDLHFLPDFPPARVRIQGIVTACAGIDRALNSCRAHLYHSCCRIRLLILIDYESRVAKVLAQYANLVIPLNIGQGLPLKQDVTLYAIPLEQSDTL